ncbi:hypothetical protein BG011_002175, partial [Mortierella polycephala]
SLGLVALASEPERTTAVATVALDAATVVRALAVVAGASESGRDGSHEDRENDDEESDLGKLGDLALARLSGDSGRNSGVGGAHN